MTRTPELARRFFDRFEPVHAVTYFAPEALGALENLGYRGLGTGYFAARSAPLGPVPAAVVTALFYNFSPAQVARYLPAAWSVAPPADALRARLTGAAAALRRTGVGTGEQVSEKAVATAAALCAKAVGGLDVDGRPLFAANTALPWPEDPVEKLWHATTLLREHRGDGHVAALVAAGISGRQANVLHWAAGAVPLEFIKRSRAYDDAEWHRCVESLCARGLLTADGTLTDAGHELKSDLEATTDRVALPALAALDDDEVEALFAALTPITRQVVAGGDVPAGTPMGLRRDELDDDSAHLG